MQTTPQSPQGENPIFDVPPRKSSSSSQRTMWIVATILGIIALLIIGWIIFNRFVTEKENDISEPTPDVSFELEKPTPTPGEEIDKSDIKIEVLNGTGIAKEASFLQNKLGTLKYEDVETGNADSKDYDTAQVAFYKTFPKDLKDELLDLLSDIYNKVEDVDSSGESDIDVRIITGLRPGITRATPKPTAEDEDDESSESSSPSSSLRSNIL